MFSFVFVHCTNLSILVAIDLYFFLYLLVHSHFDTTFYCIVKRGRAKCTYVLYTNDVQIHMYLYLYISLNTSRDCLIQAKFI
jgi:hypothetical protein